MAIGKNYRPDRKIFILAAVITLSLFALIYSLNVYLNSEREEFLEVRMGEFITQYEDMQALDIMGDVFGEKMTCLAMERQLKRMDTTLWDTGIKLDKYRQLTEEYMKNPFYLEQKTRFNKNEILYLSMLKTLEKKCAADNTIILFFYKKQELCPDCDAQSFVLTDIKREFGENISIFSFDSDLGIQTVDLLSIYYNVSTFPCVVISERSHCGIKDKREIISTICSDKNASFC